MVLTTCRLCGRADWNDCLNLNCFSTVPGESFQTTGPSEGPVAESVFIAGMYVKYGRDYEAICRHLGLDDEADAVCNHVNDMIKAVTESGWDGEWFYVHMMPQAKKLAPMNVKKVRFSLNHKVSVLWQE